MKKTTFRAQITKMLLWIALVGFVITIIIYSTDRKETKENMINNMITENTRVSLVLDISFNSINELYNFQNLDYIARNILMKSNSVLNNKDSFENAQYMENMLTHVLFMNKILARATIISEHGDTYTYGYYLTDDYISAVIKQSKTLGNGSKVLYTEPRYYNLNNVKCRLMTIMRNIVIYEKNRIGVLYIDVDYDKLKKIIMSTLGNDKNSNIIILNKDEVIYSINENTTNLDDDRLDSIIDCSKRIDNSEYGRCEVHKEKYIVTTQKNDSTGWTIVQYESESKLFSQINKEMILRLILIVSIFALSAMVSYIFARKISRPLELFDQQIKAQNNGEPKMVEFSLKNASEEINNVIISYNDLIIRINDYIHKMIIYETNQKIVQMTMLRYQINPHFMFNTLNTIRSLAIINDEYDIAMMIDNLSKIMQYNVHGSRCVLLKDEMKMIHSYMIIQKFRFPDSFDVEYNIDPSLESTTIIKFIIQPIVENIFEHGFKNSMKYKGKIKISAYIEAEDLFIDIMDNGIGMTQEHLRIMEETLQNSELEDLGAENTKWNSNIGMLNVHARLKNYYGKEYGITLYSKDGMGTTVRLKMKMS
jgi:sensor histidine kinase YesM